VPAWIHDRVDHLRAKNPSMPESEAWALATQQSHALGKSPKGYGTAEGRAVAKKKFNTPKDDVKAANPGGLKMDKAAADVMMMAFLDELENIKAAGALGDFLSKAKAVATTPIPGTPELMPGIAHAADKLKGLSASTGRQGASKGFQAFQAARSAAGH
jgi:hypothetical protein